MLSVYVYVQVSQDAVLAEWTFFNPAVWSYVNEFVKTLQKANSKQRKAGDPTPAGTGTDGYGHEGKGDIRLTSDRVQDLRTYLAEMNVLYNDKGVEMIVIIKQCHGDMVHVPAGYMHQVTNILPCVKIAWDQYVVQHLHRYALSWRYISSKIRNSPDYMSSAVLVKQAILDYSQRLA